MRVNPNPNTHAGLTRVHPGPRVQQEVNPNPNPGLQPKEDVTQAAG